MVVMPKVRTFPQSKAGLSLNTYAAEDPDFSVLPPHVLRTLCEAASDDEAVVDDGVAFDGGAASSKVHNWLEGTHLPPDSGFVSRQSPVDEGYQADNEGDKINAA